MFVQMKVFVRLYENNGVPYETFACFMDWKWRVLEHEKL